MDASDLDASHMPAMDTSRMDVDVVIPTIGRLSLLRLLGVLASASGPRPATITVVDDRPDQREPLDVGVYDEVSVVAGRAAGPGAARNTGWRIGSAEWVAFIDDDVLPGPRWLQELAGDLADLNDGVGGSQGMLKVPLPADRRPTDWERNVAGLASARWATADMAYRRAALAAVGGFDHRFPRAYREDADLAIRVQDAGFVLVQGARTVNHPVPPADRWVSVAPPTRQRRRRIAPRHPRPPLAPPGGHSKGQARTPSGHHCGRRSRDHRIDHSTACTEAGGGGSLGGRNRRVGGRPHCARTPQRR